MGIGDRLLTIVVTATLTSAAWLVAGGALMRQAEQVTFGSGGATLGAPREAGSAPAASGRKVSALHRTNDDIVSAPVGALVIPVAGVRAAALSDSFTQARDGGERLHEAIDIMAPTGTPVIAAAPGRVEKLFVSGAGGNTVYVRSIDGRTIYYYAHLDAYAPGLREGQSVAAGAAIGTVGWSGNADPSAPHLHFAVMQTSPGAQWWEPAAAVNPYPLLTRR